MDVDQNHHSSTVSGMLKEQLCNTSLNKQQFKELKWYCFIEMLKFVANTVILFNTYQPPTESWRTHKILEGYTVILVNLSQWRKILSSPQDS